jgi:hypothetical protein
MEVSGVSEVVNVTETSAVYLQRWPNAYFVAAASCRTIWRNRPNHTNGNSPRGWAAYASSIPLWNWWDPKLHGYSPENRQNSEWSGWGPEHALRISWLNWRKQLRVKPAQNLMAHVTAKNTTRSCGALIPQVQAWWQHLPAC